MELHGQWFSDLHINRKVVSDIGDASKGSLLPPNKTTTLKSGPQPKITAECPYRLVMAVGRATCRMVEKQTLHRGNWKTNHIHVYYSNIEATRGHSRHVHVVRSLLNYSGLRYHGYVHHLLVLHSNTKIIHVYIMFT